MPRQVIWEKEENVLCSLFSRAWASIYPDAIGTDLSSVLDSVPSLTPAARAQDCHVPGQMVLHCTSDAGCHKAYFSLLLLGGGRGGGRKGHQLLQSAAILGTLATSTMPPGSLSRKSNKQRNGFGGPIGYIGGDGLGIVERKGDILTVNEQNALYGFCRVLPSVLGCSPAFESRPGLSVSAYCSVEPHVQMQHPCYAVFIRSDNMHLITYWEICGILQV